ncbi:hypothetical protein, partial [Dyella sp. AtDHG13]|uniref:hypothetical protein n=1 Tax=Dyella sp. AtDHG13 TaxID=1938897 RepID=UPI001F2678C3
LFVGKTLLHVRPRRYDGLYLDQIGTETWGQVTGIESISARPSYGRLASRPNRFAATPGPAWKNSPQWNETASLIIVSNC